MLRGLYAAATSLDAASQAQEIQAHNLSHVNTPGYRQRTPTNETFDRVLARGTPPTGDYVGTRLSGAYFDFKPGALQHTNHHLDFALGDSDTFFTLAAPNGNPLYTRNGAFYLNQANEIVSEGGYRLLSEAGPISVPADTAQLNVASDGSVTADGAPVGRIQLARFSNPERLTTAGPTLFSAPPNAGQTPAEGRVLQGYRESSNVNAAEAMVKMMVGQRYYDAAQRSLRAISEAIQQNTRPS
jgi:flagellar basal-body rod protein FlgF